MNKVFITGSSRGLGKALAEAFLRQGDQVIGISRSSSIEHANYHHLFADLTKAEELEKIHFDFDDSFEQYILINNAADLGEISYVGNLDSTKIINTFQLNTLTPFLLINTFLKDAGNNTVKKRVLNIGTGAAVNPLDGWSVYCASKAAVNMLSSVIDSESTHRERDFILRTLSPGVIDTAMQKQIRSAKKENFSNLQHFIDVNDKGELPSAKETAEKILLKFKDFFNHKEVIVNLRDFN